MNPNTKKENYSNCFIIEKNENKSEERPNTTKPSWKNNESNKKTYPNSNSSKGNSSTKNTAPMNWKSKKFSVNEPEKEKEPELEYEKLGENVEKNITNPKLEKKTNAMKKQERKNSL